MSRSCCLSDESVYRGPRCFQGGMLPVERRSIKPISQPAFRYVGRLAVPIVRRLQAFGFGEVGGGLAELMSAGVEFRARGVCLGRFWLEADGGVEIGECMFKVE